MKKILFGLALLVTTPALAEKKAPTPPPVEPASHPDWAAARAEGERQMREGLYDPEGARIIWKRGFTWTSWKQGSGGLLNKRRWGWLACGTINGKNMMGAYTGERAAIIVVTPEGQVTGAINGQAPG